MASYDWSGTSVQPVCQPGHTNYRLIWRSNHLNRQKISCCLASCRYSEFSLILHLSTRWLMLGSYHIEVLVNTIHINIQVTFTTLFFFPITNIVNACVWKWNQICSHISLLGVAHISTISTMWREWGISARVNTCSHRHTLCLTNDLMTTTWGLPHRNRWL